MYSGFILKSFQLILSGISGTPMLLRRQPRGGRMRVPMSDYQL